MGIIATAFLNLFKQLIGSKGRAYYIPVNTSVETLSVSLDGSGSNIIGTTERLVNDGNQLFNDIIPDNAYFTDGTADPNDNDCNDWERRLGLVQYGVTNYPTTPTTAQRMAAIAQKMPGPGDGPRQSLTYLQACLQQAGFNVYVYENPFNLTPEEILGVPAGRAYYGAFNYGEVDYGEDWSTEDITIIANSVDPLVDDDFVIPPGNNHGTFFIGGSTLGSFATVLAAQETQFRQLVLDLKGAHMAAFTFINFT